MKIWYRIISLLLLIPFVFSTSGILIFQSYCCCTGKNVVSLYISPSNSPDCCDTEQKQYIHLESNPKEDAEKACPDCFRNLYDCACSKPDVKYLKLKYQFLEDDIKFVKSEVVKILAEVTIPCDQILISENSGQEFENHFSPPHNKSSRKEILNLLCQYKIPDIG